MPMERHQHNHPSSNAAQVSDLSRMGTEVARLSAENLALKRRLQLLACDLSGSLPAVAKEPAETETNADGAAEVALSLENERLKQKLVALELDLLVKEEQVEYLYRNLILSRRQLHPQPRSVLSFNPGKVKLELRRLETRIIRESGQSGLEAETEKEAEAPFAFRIPAEVWVSVFQFLAIPSIAAASATCKRLYKFSQNLSLRAYWRRAYHCIWLNMTPCPRLNIKQSGNDHEIGRRDAPKMLVRTVGGEESVDWRARVAARFPIERNWRGSNPVVYTLNGHQGTVTCLHYVGDTLVTGSDDGSMICWSLQDRSKASTQSASEPVSIMQQHHKQTRSNCSVRKHSLSGHGGPVWCCFSDQGQVVSGSYDKTIKVWDLASGKCLRTLRGSVGWLSSIAFSAERKRIISASWDASIRVWRSDGGQVHSFPTAAGNSKYSLQWDTATGRLLTGCRNHQVQIWDAPSATLIQAMHGHTNVVHSVANAADSSWVVSGSADASVRLWDVRSGTMVASLDGHASAVMGVKADATLCRIVSCSYDKTIKIWDTRKLSSSSSSTDVAHGPWEQWTGAASTPSACIRTLAAHAGAVFCVQFDENKILSGSADKSAKVLAFHHSI